MRFGINFHTYDNYISGVDYFTLGLVNGLLSIDKENEYVVYTNKPRLFDKHVSLYNNLKVVSVDHLKSRIKRIYWEHFVLPWIAKKDKLNLLHCPSYIAPLIKTEIPYIVTIHDTFAIDNPQWCRWSNRFNYRIFMPRTSFKAEAVLAVSNSTRENLLKLNRHINPIVVYPGIDSDFVPDRNNHDDWRVRTKYNLPDSYLLYVGNIEPKKNIKRLLDAFQIIKSKIMPYKLVLAGKRIWLQDEVWDYIKKQFSSDEIVLTGYVDREDLPVLYRLSEMFIFPSLEEGFGFPPLEAMRCGVPVIASPTGILKELPDDIYFKVNPNDVMDIADKIIFVLEDRTQRNRRVELALQETAKFSWSDCARKTLDIYKRLAI